MSRYDRYSFFPPSKSKGERIADAERQRKALEKKGAKLSPVVLKGAKIAATFWGKAWCDNIESYRDYAYRLERGRSYVRSNSVIDLTIAAGTVQAQVMGSECYRVAITVKPVVGTRWTAIRKACAGKIGSLIELLHGRISGEVMAVMTHPGAGLFPEPSEIAFTCSCPDSAVMCKHVAAVMYGIGNRLDTQPELLFLLRGVDTADLIASAAETPAASAAAPAEETLSADDLADVFGVELETGAVPPKKPRGRPKKSAGAPVTAAPKRPRGRPPKTEARTKTVPPRPASRKEPPTGRTGNRAGRRTRNRDAV
jgi:uncharacterized Zn finger protein